MTEPAEEAVDNSNDSVKRLLDLIKHSAEIDRDNNAAIGANHSRQAEEVVTSLAAIKTIQGNELELLKAVLGSPQ